MGVSVCVSTSSGRVSMCTRSFIHMCEAAHPHMNLALNCTIHVDVQYIYCIFRRLEPMKRHPSPPSFLLPLSMTSSTSMQWPLFFWSYGFPFLSPVTQALLEVRAVMVLAQPSPQPPPGPSHAFPELSQRACRGGSWGSGTSIHPTQNYHCARALVEMISQLLYF